MQFQNMLSRMQHKVSLSLTETRLKSLAKKQKSTIIDYGWVKLPYSDDGDKQELLYHHYCMEYYKNDSEVLRNYVKENDFVIDVGANMGFITVILASLVGDNGRVLSFEPLKNTFEKLKTTIAANNLAMVEPINLGLDTQDAVHNIYSVSNSSGNNTMVKNSNQHVVVGQVRTTSLDSFLSENDRPISFMKIDTEGYEHQVLLGGAHVIQKYRPVIYIELCKEYRESSAASVKLLESWNYRLPKNFDLETSANGMNYIATPL